MRTFGASAQLSSTPLRNQPIVATAIASESRKMAAVVSTPSVGRAAPATAPTRRAPKNV